MPNDPAPSNVLVDAPAPARGGASFLDLAALDPDAVEALVARALELRHGAAPKRFEGRALGLLFLNPSLRTQASMQRAAGRLGLDAITLQGGSTWSLESRDGAVMDGTAAEHVRDAAGVLGRYVDVLGVRSFAAMDDLEQDLADTVVRTFARHAGVPVVNLESAQWHPCQALADRVTLERLSVPRRGRCVLTWAWHPRPLPHAVPNSAVTMAAQRGMDVVVLRPRGYDLHPRVMARAGELADAAGGELTVTDDRAAALAGADVVYAKSWASLEDWGDADADLRRRQGLRDWCVTPEWLGARAHFLHCLPVRRNVVAADAVMDGPRSAVLEQAENRLHAQTAVLEGILS